MQRLNSSTACCEVSPQTVNSLHPSSESHADCTQCPSAIIYSCGHGRVEAFNKWLSVVGSFSCLWVPLPFRLLKLLSLRHYEVRELLLVHMRRTECCMLYDGHFYIVSASVICAPPKRVAMHTIGQTAISDDLEHRWKPVSLFGTYLHM